MSHGSKTSAAPESETKGSHRHPPFTFPSLRALCPDPPREGVLLLPRQAPCRPRLLPLCPHFIPHPLLPWGPTSSHVLRLGHQEPCCSLPQYHSLGPDSFYSQLLLRRDSSIIKSLNLSLIRAPRRWSCSLWGQRGSRWSGRCRECFQGKMLAQTLESSITKWLAKPCIRSKTFRHIQETGVSLVKSYKSKNIRGSRDN